MIIVNQGKNTIVNFDRVETIYIVADLDGIEGVSYKICYKTNSGRNKLGEYKTGARAKEVLKEIVEKYSSYLELKGGVAFMQGGMNIQPNIFNIPKVFEMPKE